MRLWSLDPKYLDRQGLLAVWRESLLAKRVLEGRTRGYKKHPQLARFYSTKNPLLYINTYLFYIHQEALKRGYNFSVDKINFPITKAKIRVRQEQLNYEFRHLLGKLKIRNRVLYQDLLKQKKITPNSLFKPVSGPIESWEKIK